MARDSSKVSATAVAVFFTVATMPLLGLAFFRAATFLAATFLAAALDPDRPFVPRFARAGVLARTAVFRAFAILSLPGLNSGV
jgi:hypothetical protein